MNELQQTISKYEKILVGYVGDISRVEAEIEQKEKELNSLAFKKKQLLEDKERILGALGALEEVLGAIKGGQEPGDTEK